MPRMQQNGNEQARPSRRAANSQRGQRPSAAQRQQRPVRRGAAASQPSQSMRVQAAQPQQGQPSQQIPVVQNMRGNDPSAYSRAKYQRTKEGAQKASPTNASTYQAARYLGNNNYAPKQKADFFTRGSLIAVAAVSTAVAAAVGVALGFAVSTKGRFADVLSYLLDLLLVIPSILVVMVLVFGLGSGVGTMIVVTTAVSAPYIARYTRSLVRPVAASPYVTAARLSGDSAAKTAVREVLPNLAVPLATTVGMRFINSVYLVATAAFLGFDPLGTGSDWGTMIQTGVTGISLNPWAALAPTIAIACITISGNLLLDRIGKRSNL